MSKKWVITFYCISFCFTLNVFFLGNEICIKSSMISWNCVNNPCIYWVVELFSSFFRSIANNEIDEFFSNSINNKPYPEAVFFEPIYVCISSISTTTISFSLRNSVTFSPNFRIQFKTETLLTFKILPMDLNPSPSR